MVLVLTGQSIFVLTLEKSMQYQNVTHCSTLMLRSVRCNLHLFNTGFNQEVLADSLDSNILRKKWPLPTLFGLHQFVTFPYGLGGAAVTVQCLMDRILHLHSTCAAVYLDHSN